MNKRDFARNITRTILDTSQKARILLVIGPRQSGKTTLLKSLMPTGVEHISLKDDKIRTEAVKNPEHFLNNRPTPILIDDIHLAPELFRAIVANVKSPVDSKSCPQYYLASSWRPKGVPRFKKSQATSVSGLEVINLSTLMYSEIHRTEAISPFNPTTQLQLPRGRKAKTPQRRIREPELFEEIFRGGMPRLHDLFYLSREAYFQSYVESLIENEGRILGGIRGKSTRLENSGSTHKFSNNPDAFLKFLQSVARHTGEPLDYEILMGDAGISFCKARSWLSVMEDAGLVYLLKNFQSSKNSPSAERNMATCLENPHPPKIIFMDTGLACYLAGFSSTHFLRTDIKADDFLETYAISEIVKNYWASGIEPEISYLDDVASLIFRCRGDDGKSKVFPFQISTEITPDAESVRNFRKLRNIGGGGVICLNSRLKRLNRHYLAVPINKVLNPQNS